MPDPCRFLKYLQTITEHRLKTVYDIQNYEQVLWLKNIPQDAPPGICFTRAWGANNQLDDADIWIKIKKWKEPCLKNIPPKCKEWIKEETLNDDTIPPQLHNSIDIEEDNPERTPNNTEEERTITQKKSLQDYPEISNAWDNYISQEWESWSNLHKKWKLANDIYSKLFSIHQMQIKLGEEYELVLGIGFLQWKINRDGCKPYECKRHIIVANVQIDSNAEKGEFEIRPAMDPASSETILSNEFDMLRPEDQASIQTDEIEELLKNCNDLWDRADIDPILNATANTLGEGNGDYQHDNLEFRNYQEKEKRPLIDFAPALILRKRNIRRIQEVIQAISEQIQKNDNIPKIFSALCENENKGIEQDNPFQDNLEGNTIAHPNNEIDYFPLPSNKEQSKILSFANANSGILVQGPPGTGKSHTIANLICHLLATGKRILITAKTPHALKVLRDKLPESIQPLCINLLDKVDRQSLENSVQGILSKDWDDDDATQKIKRAYEDLARLKRKQADLNHTIRERRESEYRPITIANTGYQGKATKIAKRINKEKEKYNWFEDEIRHDLCPFEMNKLIGLWQNLQKLTIKGEQELKLKLPTEEGGYETNKMEFSMLVREELPENQGNDKIPKTDQYRILLEANNLESVRNIIEKILGFNSAVENIRNIPLPKMRTIVSGMPSSEDNQWKYVFNRLPVEKRTKKLSEKSDVFENIDFEFPKNIERKKLLADAKKRSTYFNKGGKRGFWIFSPEVVRKTNYIEQSIRVDGQECKSQELLNKVIDFLELQNEVSYYWSLLERIASQEIENEINTPLSLQILKIDRWRKDLERVLEAGKYCETAKEEVAKIDGIGEIIWHSEESVSELLTICQHYVSEKAKQRISKIKEYLENFLEQENICRPLTENLLDAVINRDINQYTNALNKIKDFDRINADYTDLENLAPSFAEMIKENYNENLEEKIYQIEDAWKWAKAKSYLETLLNKDIQSIERELRTTEDGIKRRIEELASLKAWKSFFEKIAEHKDFREHLAGWQQAIRKVGRGTGKHANRHRKDAQVHLNHCRKHIPAWIMPLYRVYETVKVEPEIFDVIIVDEASQCDIDSFLLTYMGKQLIIVGDDQQISPEPVGMDQDIIFTARKKYLYDFEHADLFSLETSLFDYGRRKFSQQTVVLKEHFRCMPEIIGFSNRLCYSGNPLIPLRQYSTERLDPLVAIPVNKGYRNKNGVFNEPEAEVVVEKIVECCGDPRYEGKTMGVIVLQGMLQAKSIEKLLFNKLDAEEIEERKLVCGDSYSFQGDERDIIFLSMVADADHAIALTKESHKRRFNVAASRAKDQMWLVHTVTINDLNPRCYRRQLLEHFYNPRSPDPGHLGGYTIEELRQKEHQANTNLESRPRPYDSWFELRVALMIAGKGYQVIPQYSVGNYSIDLVIGSGQSLLAVECDGDYWHGPEQHDNDMQRQRHLERCGWYFYRVKEYMFYAAPEKVWEELKTELQARNITPKEIDFVGLFATKEPGDFSTDNPPLLAEMLLNTMEAPGDTSTQLQGETQPSDRKTRRPNINFTEMGIPKGAILEFKKDRSIRVEIIDEKNVRYDGTPWKLSPLTKKLLGTTNHIHATTYWTYKDKSLKEIYEETYAISSEYPKVN